MKYKIDDKFEIKIIKIDFQDVKHPYVLETGESCSEESLDNLVQIKIKEQTDWSKVPINTPIMVRPMTRPYGDKWIVRHFAGANIERAKGPCTPFWKIYYWIDGKTSHTVTDFGEKVYVSLENAMTIEDWKEKDSNMKYKIGDKFKTEIIEIDNNANYPYKLECGMSVGDDFFDLVTQVKKPINWAEIPLDTPIMVRDDNFNWRPRYFTGTSNNGTKVVYWADGRTSYTARELTMAQITPTVSTWADSVMLFKDWKKKYED